MSDEVCKNKGKPFNNYNVRNDAIVAKPIIDSAHKDDIIGALIEMLPTCCSE